ncbi:hypothetical protein [Halomicrobium urmianum]|uniref:hypothetical protein n=1 Tax=Halomicrobium urmianum TaxID=1586233 RepID=UPI001CD9F5A0|nr:hypothetical protein [Halomicrobium urmianum]
MALNERSPADLAVRRPHGRTDVGRFPLGTVAPQYCGQDAEISAAKPPFEANW